MALEVIPILREDETLFGALKTMAQASITENENMLRRADLVADILANGLPIGDKFRLDSKYAIVQFNLAFDESLPESKRDEAWRRGLNTLNKYRTQNVIQKGRYALAA
jgi:hypothetical protein